MVSRDSISSLIPRWNICFVDGDGFSRGLISTWDPCFGRFNTCFTHASLLCKGWFKDLGFPVKLLNYYSPYQDRKDF